MIEVTTSSERYQVLRRIGAGGMGVVYEAEDRERGQRVALKTIANPSVEKIYRLKREFRALADLGHPNLVALYDLVADAGSCFFTMELLDGLDLLSYVWGRTSKAELALANTTTEAPPPTFPGPAPMPSTDAPTLESGREPSPCDFDRMRAVLPQLARGLTALHEAGKIHRDVKPSNILVTREGRVVLLDFGLVAELERKHDPEAGMIVGTAAYMAPEQCAGDVALTPSADWYALGVVLFQAFTNHLPFEGTPERVMHDKQTRAAHRPSRFATGIPADLDELCAELLERDPHDRPGGAPLLRRLGVTEGAPRASSRHLSRDGAFAGRDAELAALEAALAPLDRRRASVAVVRAPSGMGKSALIARFFERVRATRDDAVLLRGRCLEREDIPYKAIDPLIDELSDFWLGLGPKDAQALLPRDACLLPTLFPVLDRVPAIADAPRTRAIADPQARRTHAFDALRETFQRLADRHPVVLWLDDMQWVDRDTTTLLADLMRAPDPPPLLVVLATRVDGSEPVLELVRRLDAERTILDLPPLPEDDAAAIALAHLGDDDLDRARRLVREAEGSPLFLIELARYLQGRSVDEIAGKGLDAMLTERIDGLGETARVLAEVVAVAGAPVSRRLLAAATSVPNAELARQLQVLRAQRIVRTQGARADDDIEPYHARVRSAVIAGMPADRRARHHRALATALSGKGTAEQLARHWHGSGDVDHAAVHARRAGDEARARLDFDLSARWYAIALAGNQWTDAERRELRTQYAEALADAGRPRDAADQYLAAATGADASAVLELRRRAAGALLQSGYLERGLELTRDVLAGVGLRMARTPVRALASMLVRRAWLRLRGLGFQPRALSEISQAERTRVDVCEGVSFGLALVDSFQAMDFGTRFLLGALRLGERWRVSRALALETDLLAATAQRRRATRLLDRLIQLTEQLVEPAAGSQLVTTRAFLDFFVHNRFRAALDGWTAAIADYRAVVGRAGFELDTVSIFCCWALYYLGELGELSRRVPAMAEAATRNGNRYTAITLRCAFPAAWLARLEPDAIEAELEGAVGSWATPDGGYQLQHLLALCSRVDLALYRGRPGEVGDRIARELPKIRRALLDRVPVQAVLLCSTLVRHALARGEAGEARRWLRAMRKLRLPMAPPAAAMFEGALAELEGRPDAAIARYRACLPELERFELRLFVWAVRHRLGALVGGDEGAALRAGVRAQLEAEGVRDPDAMLAMLLPAPGGRG